MKAGPRNGQTRRKPRVRPSREARAALATAASPGSAPSTAVAPFPVRPAPALSRGTGSTRPVSSSVTLRSGLFTARPPADSHALGELRPEWMRPAGDLDHDRAAERFSTLDPEAIAGLNLALRQVAQHRCVAVGDSGEGPLFPRLELGQRNGVVGADRQLPIRDRISVRIEYGLAQLCGDELLELFGDVVLQHLSLLVNPVPRHSQHLRQEELDQAVVADRLQGDELALGRQPGAVVGLVIGESLL